MEVERGSTLTLVSPSESGKSLLSRCLNRLEDVGRPTLERPVNCLLAVLHPAGGGTEAAQRDHTGAGEEGGVTRVEPTHAIHRPHAGAALDVAAMILTMLGIGVTMVASLAGGAIVLP